MKTVFSFAIALAIINYGCKGKNYEFVAVNKTHFTILEFRVDDKVFPLAAHGASEKFKLKLIKNCPCFDAPGIRIGVEKYSDSTGTRDHNLGTRFQNRDFSAKRTNTIIIQYDSKPNLGPPEQVFEYHRE
jgi:hypothetical protein